MINDNYFLYLEIGRALAVISKMSKYKKNNIMQAGNKCHALNGFS